MTRKAVTHMHTCSQKEEGFAFCQPIIEGSNDDALRLLHLNH